MNTLASCGGACQQGRFQCPTPTACETPESDLDCASGIIVGIVAALSLYCCVVMAWLLLR